MRIYGIIPNEYDACYLDTFYETKEQAKQAIKDFVDEANRKRGSYRGVPRPLMPYDTFCVQELNLVLANDKKEASDDDRTD